MATADAQRNELGEFFKARRAELTPAQVGLPQSGAARRVPGLRREEVAHLAAISTDYYTRVEQGRLQASEPVLSALARALHLDEDQTAYVKGLHGAKRRGRPQRRPAPRVRPQLQRLLDQLTDSPALVLGRHMDILAWNSLAASLITDFSALPPGERNYLRLAFVDPHVRGLFADWETTARTCVAYLRMDALQYPDDPRLATLVGELSVRDPDFRQWWAAHDVAHKTCGTKKLNHPVAGELTLDWEILGCATDPDQQLMVMTAVPGSAAQESLRFLASWTGPDNSPPREPSAPAADRPGETHPRP
ncbi:helix-turn-helix domain-containing protein [Streptomyces sp. NRRL S-1824]|uniref:helix-turn-helix domain-containing protein n=1 Tax=Streptomyces sp. NRRL S-1824 TaxID=1463889 RepID=UPI0004C5927A|nr:helix-turn-helix domain-containing protein [Streptomyces sp. NRRL S-1824]